MQSRIPIGKNQTSGLEPSENKSNSVADIESTTKFPVWKVVSDLFQKKEVGKSLIADTEITRLATVTNQDISGKIDITEKAAANGVATLDANGKQPLAQVNDALFGNLKWYGLYNGITVEGSPVTALNGNALPSPSIGNVGWYFIANGDFVIGGVDYKIGDWLISNGTTYVKVDNTDAVSSVAGLTGVVSVENLRIALDNVTNVSIQDLNGVEKFKITDALRFENVSFNPSNKTISIDSLVPLSAFLNIISGSDITGAIENSKKPFKTIEKLISSLPETNGETYTIYLNGGIVPVLRRLPCRNIRWVAYQDATLDFTNCLENDGITHALRVLVGSTISTWYFDNENIGIKSDYVGIKIFASLNVYTTLILKGVLRSVNWNSVNVQNFRANFYLKSPSNIFIKNYYSPTQDTVCFDFNDSDALSNIEIGTYHVTNPRTLVSSELLRNKLTINNILQVGSAPMGTLTIGANAVPNIILNLKNITYNGIIKPDAYSTNFESSISANTSISFNGINTGYITSSSYNNTIGYNPTTFKNFTGKFKNSLIYNTVTFESCYIEINGNFLGQGAEGISTNKIAIFKGYNSIYQNDLTKDMFYVTNTADGRTVPIEVQGVLNTNAKSYGMFARPVYNLNTFKEKLTEVVIRSKSDLINRKLDSTMNYIIDGTIVLLPTESIIVPIGGLSLSGYGFDVSAIKATGNNSTIFTSPVEGSGNLFTQNISIEASGTGSKVFNLTNAGAATGGADAIELGVVNFDNCTSLGTLKNFRQGLWDNIGVFGCKDGLTFEGVWSGGFRADLVISRNFGVAGVGGTLFKAGADLLFKSRFLTDANADFKTSGNLSDFTAANFNTTKLYQVKAAQVTRNGVLDDTQNYTGTLSAFSPECDWSGNNGMKNSNLHPYGIATDKMGVYANDVDAATGGVVIGEVYIEATTGYFKTRLT